MMEETGTDACAVANGDARAWLARPADEREEEGAIPQRGNCCNTPPDCELDDVHVMRASPVAAHTEPG